MLREIRAIPPAPRRVRWGKVMGLRWPVALVGCALAVYGGLFTWMLFLAYGGKASDDEALDRGPVESLPAVVVLVEGGSGMLAGMPAERIRYQFESDGQQQYGTCFAAAGSHREGDAVWVQRLPEARHVHRIAGTVLDLLPWWLQPATWFALAVVPGLLLLLGWFAGVLHLRQVFAQGDVSTARIVGVRRVRFVLPQMLDVRFRFLDHRAGERRGRHWVRVHGELGRRVLAAAAGAAGDPLPVLHDRRWPQFHRLCLPDDFVPTPAPALPQEPITR